MYCMFPVLAGISDTESRDRIRETVFFYNFLVILYSKAYSTLLQLCTVLYDTVLYCTNSHILYCNCKDDTPYLFTLLYWNTILLSRQ